jgi:integral membrane sensor domain MASE1
MRKSLFSIVTASALVAGAGLAVAQTSTTTTTTWTPEQGSAITQYSTTQHYQSYSQPGVTVGTVLPQTMTVYPLPSTVEVPTPNSYSYTIVNNQPVVVDRTTRQVVHVW